MKLRDFAFATLAIVGIGASLSAQSDPAASPPPGFVTGIKAVGIHVRQIDRTLKFYTEGLGFVEKGKREHDGSHEIFLSLPDAEPTATVLILQDAADASGRSTADGPAPLVLTTRDIEKAVARLQQLGYAAGEIHAMAGRKIAVVQDPEGTRIELYEAASHQP
jgi:catechol 2,3-dioxygenase-like lactoylglutathione lyase family enzyme